MRRGLRGWRKARQGSISLNFAVLILPILAGVGGTIDIANLSSAKHKLQIISDAAALTAANGNHTIEEREAMFAAYVTNAVDPKWGISDIDPKANVSHVGHNVEVTGQVSATVGTIILQHANHSGAVKVVSEAVVGKQTVELVLAIDISSSMNGARITEARAAAKQFIETLLTREELQDRINISIVPFGGTVRVPNLMSSMIVSQAALRDPDVQKHWMDGAWNGCFELSPADLAAKIKPSDQFAHMPDFYTWRKTNPWCPRNGSEFLPLTDNETVLKSKIDVMQLSDGTGTDHGMAWARANLSSDWTNRFPGGKAGLPAEGSNEVKKIIVLMTDGGVTGQHMVKTQHMTGTLPYYTRSTTRVKGADGWAAFSTVCTQAKLEGTEVYTIGYLMNNATHVDRLRACASSPARHFDSTSGELDNIFENIAATITPLRLSN